MYPLEAVSKPLNQNHDTGDVNESPVNRDASVPSDDDAPKVLEPSDGALDDPSPSIPSEFSSILSLGLCAIVAMRADQVQSVFRQRIPEGIAVIGAVGDQRTTAILRQRRPVERRFNQRRLVRGRACQVHSDRKTLAARRRHKLCTLSTFGFSHARAPFFAGENVPSAKMFIQLSWPCSSNSWMSVVQAVSQTPCSSHSRRRRQQVLSDGYDSGKSFRRAPLRKTHKMPSKQRRFEMRLRPPSGDAIGFGKSVSIFAHCASVNPNALLLPAQGYHISECSGIGRCAMFVQDSESSSCRICPTVSTRQEYQDR